MLTPVFPSQEGTKDINDNYSISPTCINAVVKRLDSVLFPRNFQTVTPLGQDSVFPQVVVKPVNFRFTVFQKDSKSGCIPSCCESCLFCKFSRATTKESYKSRSLQERNYVCQRCFLIHPIQWTIANPVGADRPAKRQKKSPYMSA